MKVYILIKKDMTEWEYMPDQIIGIYKDEIKAFNECKKLNDSVKSEKDEYRKCSECPINTGSDSEYEIISYCSKNPNLIRDKDGYIECNRETRCPITEDEYVIEEYDVIE